MATTEEIARDLLGSVATDVGFLNAVHWIDQRYRELVTRVRFRHLREIGELSVPARYNTGTASATRGSTSVTGTSTAWTTGIGSGAQEYYQFRTSVAWYKIASIGGDTALTLDSAFAEENVTDGSYNIVKRWHPLISTARWIGDFVHTRLRCKLDLCEMGKIDRFAPGRTLVGSYPLMVCQVGTDAAGNITVELYPPPEKSELIHYVYWTLPTTLAITTTIPPQIDAHVLREGATIDMFRYLQSKAAGDGNLEAAALWRNEARAQETRWERIIQEASRTSRGADDTTFILTHLGGRIRTGDIRTARDIILDRWVWPG